MKHFIASKFNATLILVVAFILTSCNTTGAGALTGAMFGGVIGSSIGGIGGGYRGSNVGTLVGMAVGAGTGAAIGAAAEAQEREAEAAYIRQERESVREHYRSLGINNKENPDDDVYGAPRRSDASGYSADPVYNDVIEMESGKNNSVPANATARGTQSVNVNELKGANETPVAPPAAVIEVSETGAKVTTPIVISNARFINDQNTTHIAKGELVKISFEIRNATENAISNVVPMVKETTGNKHLLISPSTLVERLAAHKAIRYTAYVSAEKSLRTGTAHFVVSVYSDNQLISNTIEFDIDLN